VDKPKLLTVSSQQSYVGDMFYSVLRVASALDHSCGMVLAARNNFYGEDHD
jgi:hypothetical protein